MNPIEWVALGYTIIAGAMWPYTAKTVAWRWATKTVDLAFHEDEDGVKVPTMLNYFFSIIASASFVAVWPVTISLFKSHNKELSVRKRLKELEKIDREFE